MISAEAASATILGASTTVGDRRRKSEGDVVLNEARRRALAGIAEAADLI